MYKEEIEKLLDEGATPEKIYQEALRIIEARNAAKARLEKKVADARGALLAATANYAEALTGEKIDADFLKRVENLLDNIETAVNEGPIAIKVGRMRRKDDVPSDDEKRIKEFLKKIGAEV